MIMLYLIIGYLFGSFPTAYILLRFSRGLDLRKEGSTNIGAMNSLRVTGSKSMGITIAVLDAIKGVLVVLVAQWLAALTGDQTPQSSLALVGAVAGHNYNIWLSLPQKKLAGGKGLATVAGGLFILYIWIVPIWAAAFALVLWLSKIVFFRLTVIPGSILATLIMPLFGFFLYDTYAAVVLLLAALLIIPKHIEQMRDLFEERREKLRLES